MDAEPTIGDVLEAITTFAENTEKRFDGLETRMGGVEVRLTKVENRLEGVERKLDRTDSKVTALVNVLERKAVITTDDKRVVLA